MNKLAFKVAVAATLTHNTSQAFSPVVVPNLHIRTAERGPFNINNLNPRFNRRLGSIVARHSRQSRADDGPCDESKESRARAWGGLSRRQALVRAPLVVSSLTSLVGWNVIFPPQPSSASLVPVDGKQTVVITGCNSGIGLDAATRMARRGHKVVLACRTLAKAEGAADEIRANLADGKEGNAVDNSGLDLVPAECDLASLASVSRFAASLGDQLADAKIDVLCLNAGIARDTGAKDVLRTKEGCELTVGTNHVGHFYLNKMLLPMVKRDTGRIVVTASAVHDPEAPGGMQGSKATLGDLSGLADGTPNFDMVDGGTFDADKAYKDSKLCNVLFTRELHRRLEKDGSGIVVNCFSPGLIVGTGLFRDQNPVFTKLFDIAATNLLKVGETTHWGGGALEYMALDRGVGSKGGLYYNSPPGSSKYGEDAFGVQFNVDAVSKEAQDDMKATRLWELTDKIVTNAAG